MERLHEGVQIKSAFGAREPNDAASSFQVRRVSIFGDRDERGCSVIDDTGGSGRAGVGVHHHAQRLTSCLDMAHG